VLTQRLPMALPTAVCRLVAEMTLSPPRGRRNLPLGRGGVLPAATRGTDLVVD